MRSGEWSAFMRPIPPERNRAIAEEARHDVETFASLLGRFPLDEIHRIMFKGNL